MANIFDLQGNLDDWRADIGSGDGIRGKAGRVVCDAYANDPTNGLALSQQPGAALTFRYVCDDYWDGPDGYTPPTDPTEEVPFNGGQCDGVQYRVEWTATGVNNLGNPVTLQESQFIGGPIVSATVERTEPSGRVRWDFRVENAAGDIETDDREVFKSSYNQPGAQLPEFGGPQITRQDGQPDTCGDPPPELVPSQPSPNAPPRFWGDPIDVGEPNSPFTITPSPPSIGPTGIPIVPIDTPIGPSPFAPGSGPADIPDGDEPPPTSIGSPITPGEPDGEIDSEPDGEDGAVTLGYFWSLSDANFQSKVPIASPTVYTRVAGNLQLRLQAESGVQFWGEPLRILGQSGTIYRPEAGIKVAAIAYSLVEGVDSITLTPIRGGI